MKKVILSINLIITLILFIVSTSFCNPSLSPDLVAIAYVNSLTKQDCSKTLSYCGGNLFANALSDDCDFLYKAYAKYTNYLKRAKFISRKVIGPITDSDGSFLIGFEDTYSNGMIFIQAFQLVEMSGDYKVVDHELVLLGPKSK